MGDTYDPMAPLGHGSEERKLAEEQVRAAREITRDDSLDPMDRARFYLGVLDAMILGENVGEEYYSVAFLGLSNDQEARKAFEESTGAQWPEARGMIQAFAATTTRWSR